MWHTWYSAILSTILKYLQNLLWGVGTRRVWVANREVPTFGTLLGARFLRTWAAHSFSSCQNLWFVHRTVSGRRFPPKTYCTEILAMNQFQTCLAFLPTRIVWIFKYFLIKKRLKVDINFKNFLADLVKNFLHIKVLETLYVRCANMFIKSKQLLSRPENLFAIFYYA